MPAQPEIQVRRKGISYLTDGDYVRKLRETTGCTQIELADKWTAKGKAIGHRTITKAEAGKQPILQHTLATLADIFSNEKDIKKPIHWHDLVAACEKHLLNVDSRKEASVDAVCDSLPSITAVEDFTGRTKERADIAANLRSGTTVCITAIKAAGGMGKTQLARKSAEDLASQFPDGTYLFELDGMTTPKTSMAVMKELIAKCIPGTGLLPDAMAELQPMYLAALGSKKLLLVFDNADDAGQVSPLLKDLPKSVGVIITSRKLISLPNLKRIDLEVMLPIDAVQLLNGIVTQTRSDLTEADLKAIAILCGHLPLALRVAGTMLRDDKKWTHKRFAKALQDDPLHHLTLGADEYNVDAVLRLSVQQLVIINAEQAERFQMLCVFPGTFAEDAAATVWNLDEEETFTDLSELQNRSLIEWDEKTNRYRLHDLMRPVAREAFPSDHPLATGGDARNAQAEQRHAEHYAEVLRIAGIGSLTNGLAAYDLEATNISAGRAWADAHAASDPNAAQQFILYSLNGAKLYLFRYSAIDQQELYKRCLELSVLGEFRDWEAKAKSYLGDALSTLGQVNRALVLYGEAADLNEELGEVRENAVTIGKRADLLFLQGNTEVALRDLERIKIIFHDIDDQGAKAVTMGKIAYIYEKLGQTDKALRIRRDECLTIYERLCDEREFAVKVAKIADHLQIDEALDIYLEILPLFERLGDANSKAVTMGKIANLREQRGETTEALRIYLEECIPVFERLGNVQAKAVTMGKIANIREQRGETTEALRIYREECIPVFERLGNVQAKLMCRANIGITLMNKSVRTKAEFEEAREHLKWALAIADKHHYAKATELRVYVTQFGIA